MRYSNALLLVIALFALKEASALQDINISVDNTGYQLCLTSDFTTSSCNSTQIIQLDGTSDRHILYLTGQPFTATNGTKLLDEIYQGPISLITYPLTFVFMGFMLFLFIWFIKAVGK